MVDALEAYWRISAIAEVRAAWTVSRVVLDCTVREFVPTLYCSVAVFVMFVPGAVCAQAPGIRPFSKSSAAAVQRVLRRPTNALWAEWLFATPPIALTEVAEVDLGMHHIAAARPGPLTGHGSIS
jgi:hypothetical protein